MTQTYSQIKNDRGHTEPLTASRNHWRFSTESESAVDLVANNHWPSISLKGHWFGDGDVFWVVARVDEEGPAGQGFFHGFIYFVEGEAKCAMLGDLEGFAYIVEVAALVTVLVDNIKYWSGATFNIDRIRRGCSIKGPVLLVFIHDN